MISNVGIWTWIGGAAVLIAAIATVADRRRMRRTDPDAVGFMPWTALFFVSLVVACVAIGLAAREWVAG